MAHTTVVLDKRSKKKDGTYPVKIRITHNGEFYHSVNISISEAQWNEDKKNIINHPLAAKYNNLISSRKLEIDRQLIDLTDSRKIHKMDIKQLKTTLAQEEDTNQTYMFLEHYKTYTSQLTRTSTISSLKCTYAAIDKFCDIDVLSFDQINYRWLQEFDKHMESTGLAINSRGIYLRNLKAIFNDAINCDYVSLSLYPFRKFKIAKEATAKRSLTLEQLLILRDYPCQEHQKKYRDVFMLIFYLMGINMIDLLNLKEINNGRIDFRRSKTGRLYSMKVEPEAMKVIELYRGEKYLLSVLDKYKNYKDFLKRVNTNLREIGTLEWVANAACNPKDVKRNKKEIAPIFPELTTYWARHTWATIAASLDIPKETIAAALGHGGDSVTDIYINFDRKKIDQANRKVISAIKIKRPLRSLK